MDFDYKDRADQYKKEQNQLWRSFLSALERLQNEYKATKTEIIDGLGVTRSKFYDFEKKPEKGLNIDRSSVLSLWAYLADTENRRVPKNAEKLREVLREEGPDPLLQAIGFATQSEAKRSGPASSDPQIRRVIKRLESTWVYDDAVRAYITDNILDQVLDLGRPDKTAHTKYLELTEIEDWPKKFLASSDKTVNQKYKKAVQALIRSGKTDFVSSELFELYQSILEHHELREGGTAQLRIVDCQFRALSQDLSKLAGKAHTETYLADQIDGLKQRKHRSEKIDFAEISKAAERRLVKLLVKEDSGYSLEPSSDEQDDALNSPSTPCLEAEIRYHICVKDKTETTSVRYRSTSTHVENMLRAMSHGLGYPLGVSGFSIRAAGRTEKSLARISVGLSKPRKENTSTTSGSYVEDEKVDGVYQGWWVTSNTIIGILSATADAVHRWLSTEDIDAEKYYEACFEATELSQEFYELRKALYEYTPHAISNGDERFETRTLRVIEDITQYLERYERYQNADGFKIHRQRMKNQRAMARLLLSHSWLVAGKPIEAETLLDKMPLDSIVQASDPYSYVISVYREACEMTYRFVSGDEAFIIGQQWKYDNYSRIKTSLEKVGNYIRGTKNISFDVYLVISQLYGTLGILDFYSSPSINDTTMGGYTNSTDLLIQAAHYSLRIGHTRRASQWLSFASRMCVRFSSTHKAKELHKLSASISDRASSLAVDQLFPLHTSGAKSNWSEVSHLLAKGEIQLLEQANDDALGLFLEALDIALRVGYGRVIPDCLYDISRAAKRLATVNDSHPFQGENPFEKWDAGDIRRWQTKFDHPDIANIVTPILENILSEKESNRVDLKELFVAAQAKAADIWNLWRKGSGEHPCAKSIKDETFLQPLSE